MNPNLNWKTDVAVFGRSCADCRPDKVYPINYWVRFIEVTRKEQKYFVSKAFSDHDYFHKNIPIETCRRLPTTVSKI